jgi:hypothetical protein
MLFHGPPGVGKTMLAERVPGLLPDLDLHDSLEVSAVNSLAGFNLADELITRPLYSDPTIPHRLPALLAAANEWPGQVPSPAPTRGFFFWMTPRRPNPSNGAGSYRVIADALSKLATDNLTAKFRIGRAQPGAARRSSVRPSALLGVGLGGFSSGRAMAQLRSIRSVSAA